MELKVLGNVNARERQIINAILGVHMAAMYATFGRDAIARGISDKDKRTALESAKEFGEQQFPDLQFVIE